jgi:hypothetical protein
MGAIDQDRAALLRSAEIALSCLNAQPATR